MKVRFHYRIAFWIAGVLCVLAGTSFLTIGRLTFRTSAAVPDVAIAT
jgi:hypothetical protein